MVAIYFWLWHRIVVNNIPIFYIYDFILDGEAHLISLISKTVIYRHGFKTKIRSVQFSPDGTMFAVTKENVGKYRTIRFCKVFSDK